MSTVQVTGIGKDKNTTVRSTFAKATVDTLFAFIPALPDGAFCEGG